LSVDDAVAILILAGVPYRKRWRTSAPGEKCHPAAAQKL
jgi:hypothetical protein